MKKLVLARIADIKKKQKKNTQNIFLDRSVGWKVKKLVLARIAEMDGGGGRDYKLLMEVTFQHYRLFENIMNYTRDVRGEAFAKKSSKTKLTTHFLKK